MTRLRKNARRNIENAMSANRQWTKRFLIAVVAATLLCGADVALGQEGRFYVGTTGVLELLDATYAKTTDNTDPRNISPQRGKVYRDTDSDTEVGSGFGLLAGYRRLVGQSGLYLSGELDVTLHGGSVRIQQDGVGESEGRNQYGENWPDSWAFEKDWSYGFTLKLGVSPALLRKWAGPDTSVYALAGVRRLRTRMRVAYAGCPSATEFCPPAAFVSGADAWTEHLIGWTSGIGLEKLLGENLALRGEFRYIGYESHDWLSLPDGGRIRVPAEMDSDEVDLSLGLVWYF